MLPIEVFLSRSSRDRDLVTQLAETLRRHGIPVWHSDTAILGAQQWHDEIGAALSRCDWFLLVLTPEAVASTWVRRELLFALNQERFAERIVPLILSPCDVNELSWVLPSIQTVDFTDGFEPGCGRLLRIWGIGYRATSAGT
jgi:hypothetical protein